MKTQASANYSMDKALSIMRAGFTVLHGVMLSYNTLATTKTATGTTETTTDGQEDQQYHTTNNNSDNSSHGNSQIVGIQSNHRNTIVLPVATIGNAEIFAFTAV